MNFFRALILFAVALSMPSALGGPNSQVRKQLQERTRRTWEYVGKTDSEYWFRNIRTSHRTPRKHVLTWFRIVVPAADIDYAMRGSNKIVWSELMEENGYELQLWAFNCSTNQMRSLQDVSYNGEGKVISQHISRNPPWLYATPDSIGETALRAACRNRRANT